MAEEKGLTIPNLITALKEAGFATKDDLAGFATKGDLKELREQVRQDIADAIHEQLTNYHAAMVAPEFEKLRAETRTGFSSLNERLERVEADVVWIKNDVEGLKADLSTTVEKKEFEELRRTVASHKVPALKGA